MIFLKQASRFIHTTRMVLATDKTALSTLRKKTGYTFSNCKKALDLHSNDIQQAEKWLQEQAQALGWSKASKLDGRATAQGLIGVLIRDNIGTMVEINCETDFVARNENFQKFVDEVSQVCMNYTKMIEFDGDLWKIGFEKEALNHLQLDNGKTLGDKLALLIGTVGENAVIKRAICYKTNNDMVLSGYTHPAGNNNDIIYNSTQYGKYGAIVALRSKDLNPLLQKNVCQHIVGMNPVKVGKQGIDEPEIDKDNEKCLIYQEYILDANLTVGEILDQNKIEVIDYCRYECGEQIAHNESMMKNKLNN